jgi:hypothetical protein
LLHGRKYLGLLATNIVTDMLVLKEDSRMKTKNTNSIMRNNISRIALVTTLLLLVPLLGKWPWSLIDFVTMGALIFSTALAYELIVKKVGKKYRVIIAILLLAAFLLVWTELAVGIFETPFAGS